MTFYKNTYFTKFSLFVSLVLTKVHLNLKSEASKSYLSYFWWILEPLMYVSIFYVVFGVFMAAHTDNFVIFLICGNIPFLWFSRTINNASNSIMAGRGLMNQIKVPIVLFPLVVIFQDACKSSVVFVLLIVIALVMGLEPSISWLSIPIIMISQFLFITAASMLCAALVPFIPDLKYVISTGTMMMMFASGIFYDYKVVIMEQHQPLFLLNPMANLIGNYRDVLIDGYWPNWNSLVILSVISLFSVLLLCAFYNLSGRRYPRLVLQ